MKLKNYYGWLILAVGFFFILYIGTFFSYGWTAFINPMLGTFGWTMAQISVGASLRNAESGVFNPVWGAIIDRTSPRKLMLIGVIITSVGIFLLYRTTGLVMFYTSFFILGLGSSLTQMLPNVLVSKWFKRDFGKANGILSLASGLGGVVLPLVVMIIDSQGWQTTLLYCAIGWTIIGIPLAFTYKNPQLDPELVKSPGANEKITRTGALGVSVRDALKTRAFWHINVTTLLAYFVCTIQLTYVIPYLTGIGISAASASMAVLYYSVISLGGRLVFGCLADKYRSSYLTAISLGLIGAGTFIFAFITKQSSFSMILLFAVIYGLGLSGLTLLRLTILREYFGTGNFGSLFGLNSVFVTIAQVVSPIAVGILVSGHVSYRPIWLASAGIALLGVITILTMPSSSQSGYKGNSPGAQVTSG